MHDNRVSFPWTPSGQVKEPIPLACTNMNRMPDTPTESSTISHDIITSSLHHCRTFFSWEMAEEDGAAAGHEESSTLQTASPEDSSQDQPKGSEVYDSGALQGLTLEGATPSGSRGGGQEPSTPVPEEHEPAGGGIAAVSRETYLDVIETEEAAATTADIKPQVDVEVDGSEATVKSDEAIKGRDDGTGAASADIIIALGVTNNEEAIPALQRVHQEESVGVVNHAQQVTPDASAAPPGAPLNAAGGALCKKKAVEPDMNTGITSANHVLQQKDGALSTKHVVITTPARDPGQEYAEQEDNDRTDLVLPGSSDPIEPLRPISGDKDTTKLQDERKLHKVVESAHLSPNGDRAMTLPSGRAHERTSDINKEGDEMATIEVLDADIVSVSTALIDRHKLVSKIHSVEDDASAIIPSARHGLELGNIAAVTLPSEEDFAAAMEFTNDASARPTGSNVRCSPRISHNTVLTLDEADDSTKVYPTHEGGNAQAGGEMVAEKKAELLGTLGVAQTSSRASASDENANAAALGTNCGSDEASNTEENVPSTLGSSTAAVGSHGGRIDSMVSADGTGFVGKGKIGENATDAINDAKETRSPDIELIEIDAKLAFAVAIETELDVVEGQVGVSGEAEEADTLPPLQMGDKEGNGVVLEITSVGGSDGSNDTATSAGTVA